MLHECLDVGVEGFQKFTVIPCGISRIFESLKQNWRDVPASENVAPLWARWNALLYAVMIATEVFVGIHTNLRTNTAGY